MDHSLRFTFFREYGIVFGISLNKRWVFHVNERNKSGWIFGENSVVISSRRRSIPQIGNPRVYSPLFHQIVFILVKEMKERLDSDELDIRQLHNAIKLSIAE